MVMLLPGAADDGVVDLPLEGFLATLHREALDIVCARFASAYSGLRVAATKNRHALPAGLRRKLVNLDVAFAVVRHLTGASASLLLDELRAACLAPRGGFGPAASSGALAASGVGVARCLKLVPPPPAARPVVVCEALAVPDPPPHSLVVGGVCCRHRRRQPLAG